MKNVEWSDGVVAIRPVHLAGAEAHVDGNDEENVKWLSGGWGTLEGNRAWIAGEIAAWEAGGPRFTFFVFEVETGLQVGMVDGDTNWPHHKGLSEGQANVSYNIYPAYRRRGYATRAVALVEKFLATKGLRDAVIGSVPENVASMSVASRAGYQPTTVVDRDGETIQLHVHPLSP